MPLRTTTSRLVRDTLCLLARHELTTVYVDSKKAGRSNKRIARLGTLVLRTLQWPTSTWVRWPDPARGTCREFFVHLKRTGEIGESWRKRWGRLGHQPGSHSDTLPGFCCPTVYPLRPGAFLLIWKTTNLLNSHIWHHDFPPRSSLTLKKTCADLLNEVSAMVK